MIMICKRCDRPIERQPGAGRPAAYCSKGCRRAAEYEAKRLQTALEAVEHEIRWRTIRPQGTANAEIIRASLDERAQLEERLRDVLDDTPTPAAG